MLSKSPTRFISFIATAWMLSSAASFALSPVELTSERITQDTQEAHQLRSWWEKEVVQAEVGIDFGGTRMVDGTFTFEAHGPRARFDREDGASIIYDGKTAWVSPADAVTPMGRFHVLTWPWFIMAPFKMQGDGILLSQVSLRPLNGKAHKSLLQTFGGDMGDTPDDWYRFFIDQRTDLIDGMSYIVTYGKDAETANQKPSIILYFDYTEGAAPRIAQRYELWYWDPDSGTTVGEAPKGTGTVSEIKYLAKSEADFTVPNDARELKLPTQPIDYSDYARLLETYVAATGVKYGAWFNNKSDLKALNDVLTAMAKVDLADYSKEDQAAFYINLYNAGMLHAVLKNYPLDSVKQIGLLPFSIFKKNFIQQGDRELNLDDIEKDILLKKYFDPRIHFAVNCASESCPPLLAEPFFGEKLDAQLEAQTRAFAMCTRGAGVLMDKPRIAYSELFKWYKDDFGVENPAEYLNRFREMPLPLGHAIDWIDYDWSLNSVQ
jgi:hypothetical protein